MEDFEFKEKIIDFFQVRIKESELYKVFDKKVKIEQELSKVKKADSQKQEKLNMKLKKLTEIWLKERKNAESVLVPNWLDLRAKDADSFSDTAKFKKDKRFRQATHLLKFGDSGSYAGSINCFQYESETNLENNKMFISTQSLNDMALDISYNNAIYVTPALFLMISDGKETIFEKVMRRDLSLFEMFSSDKERIKKWADAFLLLVDKERTIYPEEAKQLYFLTGDSYHLLCPLFSSTFAHSIYQKCVEAKFMVESKATREAYKNKKYTESKHIIYPDLACQIFGGAYPQNVSPLNYIRNGKNHLLSCQPPSWQKQQTPPSQSKKSFWREYDRRAWKTAKSLQQYLEKIFTQTSTMQRREVRAEMVDDLIDILLNYAAEVQNMKDHAGWSADSKLSKAEQLWLDPYRGVDDAEFRAERATNDWQSEIASQFATWLNDKISHKSKKLYADDDTYKFWKRLLEKKLALLKEDLEVMA